MKAVPFLVHLENLSEENILTAIDVEFCRFVQRIVQEPDERVLLAACLASRAYRDGNVCILLPEIAGREVFEDASQPLQITAPSLEEWVTALGKSPLVGAENEFKPLVLDRFNRLYLQKQWHNEQNLVKQIRKKANRSVAGIDMDVLQDGLNRLFPSPGETGQIDWQKIAAVSAVLNHFTVISGGPGTGKTTTVVRLLALLLEQGVKAKSSSSLALAAPTGKAAARLESSVRQALQHLRTMEEVKQQIPLECHTIHQLLGARYHTSQFRYNKDNPLPYDYIIIDEVSMVDQALMSRLMEATLDQTRILLLGDKDQLASVEAGSVLGDICGGYYQNGFSRKRREEFSELDVNLPHPQIQSEPQSLTDNIILLQKSYRFESGSGIGRLANAINQGEADESLSILGDSSFPDAVLLEENTYENFLETLIDKVAGQFKRILGGTTPEDMFRFSRQFQVLSSHRQGPWGTQYLNKRIEGGLISRGLISAYNPWYRGRPIIINENNYTLGLSNGDIGICMPDENGKPTVIFKNENMFKEVWPSQLPDFSTAFLLTVHKSQGSEFDDIWLVLPETKSKILSRELLYTAVSRARSSVSILGSPNVLREGIARKVARNSGLKDYLWT